jgi:hypothetical protein
MLILKFKNKIIKNTVNFQILRPASIYVFLFKELKNLLK